MNDSSSEPTFAEPWHARLFSLQQSLLDRGVFTPEDWSEALGAAETTKEGTDYRTWLTALETLIVEAELTSLPEIEATTAAWVEAAAITPHGEPITLARAVLDRLHEHGARAKTAEKKYQPKR